MSIDTAELKARNNIVDVIQKHVHLKKKGTEWTGLCPFHDDSKASLSVSESKQVFFCGPCDKSGDMIRFLMLLGHSFKEAAEEINGGPVINGLPMDKPKVKKVTPVEWKQLVPPADSKPDFHHYLYGDPSDVWTYHTAEGDILAHVCRFNLQDGGKVNLPLIYAEKPGASPAWIYHGFDKPRPLYNLHKLGANPGAKVLIVEGEKTADAAEKLFPNMVVTTWCGGSAAARHTDWSPLKGRTCTLWPDNDISQCYAKTHEKAGEVKPWYEQPGNHVMLIIAELIESTKIAWVNNPVWAPHKWDVADVEWTAEEALDYLKKNIGKVPTIDQSLGIPRVLQPEQAVTVEFTEGQGEPPPDLGPMPPEDLPPEDIGFQDYDDDATFKFLGFTNDGGHIRHHFFSYLSHTIVSLSATAMSGLSILQLCPLGYWERRFPAKNSKMDMSAIANYLVQTSNKIGFFSDKWIRGRGAWTEGKDIVIHTGDQLIVNGEHKTFKQHHSRFVYERGEPLGIDTRNPLNPAEANKVIEMCKLMNWEREINAHLLAGWCVIAPICGALSWRPHIWLTGESGVGKSWVFLKIVRRLLGNVGLAVQGATSEAGLRQLLQHDANPVVFDEAEGADKNAQESIQTVLGLVRASSADDGGIMAKGSSNGGGARTTRIRSCFAFASIAVQLQQQSDRTRVTILGMKQLRGQYAANKVERWEKLLKMHTETVTDEYVQRFQARTIWLLPSILENARTFAAAAAAVLGEQRAGDQLGALLAGAYSLTSNRKISYDDAFNWIKDKNWDEERGLDYSRDEQALISYLMDLQTTVESSDRKWDRNVGELVAIAAGMTRDNDVTQESAIARIRRLGMKIDFDCVVFSNSSEWMNSRLERTPWAKNYSKILMRLEGASHSDPTTFGAGTKARAVAVPYNTIFGNKMPDDNPLANFEVPEEFRG